MAVRPDQLVYRAGGAALARFGTLRKRTAGFEEVVETWARASTAAEFDRNGVLRLCQSGAVRVSFVDLDGDDVRETLAVPMEGALTQLVEHAIPGGSEADFECVQLDGVTNLAAEYAVRIEAGDDLRYAMPANFGDGSSWTASFLTIPDFASNTGIQRFLAGSRVDINNRIEVLQYTGSSDISVEVTANGAPVVVASRTCPWSAGDVVFVGIRLYAGRVYICAANITTGGTTLTESSSAGVVPFVGSPWTVQVGGYTTPGFEWEGAINPLITNNGGSAAPITDRFNAGAGMALAGDDGWMARHGKNLVLHVGGNAAGTAIQAETYSAATDMLAGTATGRVDLPPTTGYVRFGNTAEFDAATKVSMMWEVEEDVAGTDQQLFLSDSGGFAASSLIVSLNPTIAVVWFDGAASNILANITRLAGTRYMFGVAVDLSLAGVNRAKFYRADYDPITKHYGTWAELTAGKAENGAVPASLAAEAGNHQIGGGTWDGKIDTFRWKVGEAHDFTVTKPTVQEPDPGKWAHSFAFDGDGTDQIGALTGTVTGGSYVDDGRHGKGSMERWTKAGQYAFLAATDKITTADPGAGADGLAQCTWELYWTATGIDSRGLFGRADGADNQFAILELPTGLQVFVADAGADTANYVDFPVTGYAAGQRYKADVVYDGSLGVGARVAVYVKAVDAESGRYGAQTTPTPAVNGTIATTLRASALGYSFGAMTGFVNVGPGLCLDEVRIWYGVALTSAEADAESIYVAPVKAGCSHRWDFDGDAVDSIAALNGTVTGALQWYDGRQPEGLTLSGVEGIGRGRYLARKTFSRAGVGRYYDGVDYVTRTAPAGHLRDNHSWTANDGITYRTTLLGRAYTNLVSSDDLSAWTKIGTPVIASVSDPSGGTGAYSVTDDNPAGQEYIRKAVTFTGDGVKSAVFVVRERTMGAANHFLQVYQTSGVASNKLEFQITGWVSGKPTVTANVGVLLDRRYVGNGYWAVYGQTSAVTAAETHVVAVGPSVSDADGSIDVYRVNAFNDPIPPQDILDASEVRAADSFVDAYTALPQAATYLYEGVVADPPNQGGYRALYSLGGEWPGPTIHHMLYFAQAANELTIETSNGVGSVSSTVAASVSVGDRISVRIDHSAAGIAQVFLSINGAAEVAGAASAPLALPAAWLQNVVRYGVADSGGSLPANSALTKFVAASGSKTTAQMQALLETDASCLYMYVPGQYTDRGTYSMWMQDTSGLGLAYANANTTAGRWNFLRSRVRELVANASAYFEVAAWPAVPPVTTGNTLGLVAIAARETATTARSGIVITTGSGFGYFDDLTWYQLPLATPSTATKGNSLPGLTGFGNAVGVANATIVDWDSEAPTSPDVFDAAIATSALQRVVKFDTGPSGTLKRAYRLGLSGQLNGLTPGSWYSAVVGVFIPSTAAITASHVTVKAIDTAGTTTGESADAKGVWQWLHVQRQVDAGATEAYVEVQVEDSVAFGTANAYCYLAMPTVVAGRVRCIPIPNDGEGTVAKAAETNVDAYVVPSSRELTWYLKIRENGQAYAVAEGLLSRIDGGSTAPGLRIFGGGAQRYRVEYADGTTTAQVALSPSVTMGQQVEILVSYVPTTGVVTVSVSVASGTETTGTATGGANPAAWSGAYVRKGPGGAFDWIDEKIALGSHDMAAMRAAS